MSQTFSRGTKFCLGPRFDFKHCKFVVTLHACGFQVSSLGFGEKPIFFVFVFGGMHFSKHFPSKSKQNWHIFYIASLFSVVHGHVKCSNGSAMASVSLLTLAFVNVPKKQ